MTVVLISVLSVVLVVSGVFILWRDWRRGREMPPILRPLQRPPRSEVGKDQDAEVSVIHRMPLARVLASKSETAPAGAPVPAGTGLAHLSRALADVGQEAGETGSADRSRDPGLERAWSLLVPDVAAAIERVNAVVQTAAIAIVDTGEASWSLGHRGYGIHRRVLVEGESIGWLRIELVEPERLECKIRAHKAEHVLVNASATAAASPLNEAQVADATAHCLTRLAEWVAWRAAHRRKSQPEVHDQKEGVPAIISGAIESANGALSQADASLKPLAVEPSGTDQAGGRIAIAIEVAGRDVGRMHLDRLGDELEIAVGVRDATRIDLGRRARLPIEGLTVHGLAEAVASSAWPLIAHAREEQVGT